MPGHCFTVYNTAYKGGSLSRKAFEHLTLLKYILNVKFRSHKRFRVIPSIVTMFVLCVLGHMRFSLDEIICRNMACSKPKNQTKHNTSSFKTLKQRKNN